MAKNNKQEVEQEESTGKGSVFTNVKFVAPVLGVIIVALLIVVIVQAVGIKVFPNNDPRGTVSIVAVGAANDSPINGARVVMLADGNGRAVTTKENGVAEFRELKVGSYQFSVSASGYATVYATATVGLADNGAMITDVYVAESTTARVVMPKASETVTGYAAFANKMDAEFKNVRIGGAKMTLRFTAPATLANKLLTATTGADGKFTFSNLPEGATYTLGGTYTDANGVIFQMTAMTAALGSSYDQPVYVPEASKEITFAEKINNSDRFVVTTLSTMEVAEDATVSIVFNDDIDFFAGNFVTVKSGDKTVFAEKAVLDDTLTLTLLSGETWYAEDRNDATITLSGAVSVQGVTLTETTVTLVKPMADKTAPAAFAGFTFEGTLMGKAAAADVEDETLNIKWTDNEEGETYKVYVRKAAEGEVWKEIKITAIVGEGEGNENERSATLIGLLGDAKTLRDLEVDTTYDFAIFTVVDGVESLTAYKTSVTLVRE